jgi:hypothetical protein
MVDAYGAGRHAEVADAKRFGQVSSHRVTCLGAQSPNIARRVVAAQRGQIDHLNGAHQPGRLPVRFDGSPAGQGAGAAFYGASVDPGCVDPVQVQGDSGISLK